MATLTKRDRQRITRAAILHRFTPLYSQRCRDLALLVQRHFDQMVQPRFVDLWYRLRWLELRSEASLFSRRFPVSVGTPSTVSSHVALGGFEDRTFIPIAKESDAAVYYPPKAIRLRPFRSMCERELFPGLPAQEHLNHLHEIHSKAQAAAEKVQGTLEAIKTFKRLETEWPEVLPLVPKDIVNHHSAPRVRSQFPVKVDSLNSEFGLSQDEFQR